MDENTLLKVKELEIEVLRYVDDICKRNNLKYFLVGGTLLGAIRHKGFIPWDDDIDIAMFREDYNKFIKIALEDNNGRYFLQNFKTDSNYLRYITKIRINGTKFIEKEVGELDIHHGIFIDIFPLDGINPSNEKLNDLRVEIVNKILRLKSIKAGKIYGKSPFKTKRNKVIKRFLSIIPSRVFNSLIDFIYGYSNKKNVKHVTNFSSQYGWRKQTFHVDVYGQGATVKFEGYEFMAPSKWDIVLKSLYGDYMKLPPIEKRNSGHHLIHVDLGKYK